MKNTLPAVDLFAILEREFRRRARECTGCAFSLPFHLPKNRAGSANWSVATAAACSEKCRLVLDELVAKHQAAYELAANEPAPRGSRGTTSRAH